MSDFYHMESGPRSADEWQRGEEARERRQLQHDGPRQQAELDLFNAECDYRRDSGETPEERHYRTYYQQDQACTCGHRLGDHDVFSAPCTVSECKCKAFVRRESEAA